ncbi:hypothetical protein [Cupriavidus sp. CuC1]|uniref:hypothetical protein n=1 Tax=Cupriavidus sp. CuC1 TaxID=3373131 RepID=UPI0037D5778B
MVRFIRAKVSLEYLLPARAVVSSLHHLDTGIAHLAWRVRWQDLAYDIALIRATFAVIDLSYVLSMHRATGESLPAGRASQQGSCA